MSFVPQFLYTYHHTTSTGHLRKSIEYQRQLKIAQSQSIDVTNFEEKLLDFKEKFGKNMNLQ